MSMTERKILKILALEALLAMQREKGVNGSLECLNRRFALPQQ